MVDSFLFGKSAERTWSKNAVAPNALLRNLVRKNRVPTNLYTYVINNHTLKWYKGGSKRAKGTGAGQELHTRHQWASNRNWPKLTAVETIASKTFRSCQTAIKSLCSLEITSKMVWECLGKLYNLCTNNKVALYWEPGHVGVEDNKEANRLVKKGAATAFLGSKPFNGMDTSSENN